MKRSDIILQDAAITRQLNLLRFSAGERKKVLVILNQLQKDLRAKLLNDLTDFGKARVNTLLKESAAVIDAAYKEIAPGVVKESFTVTFHGASAENAAKILEGGFKVGAGKGVSGQTSADFIFTAPTKRGAMGFVKGRMGIKSPTVIEGGFSGKVLEIPGKLWDFEAMGKASQKLGVSLLPDSSGDLSMLDMPAIKKAMAKQGYGAIQFKDAGANGKTALAVLPENIKTASQIETITAGQTQSTDLLGLARSEAEATAQSFAAIGLDAALPTEAALKALVNGSLIEGAPSAAWWSKQSDDLAFKFAAQVRQGIAGNETVQQIVRRVIGSKRLGTPGIMETSRRGATALVHTSVQQVANDSRLATFKANDDIVKGVMQLSTLDSHTTAVCIAYSGASWDLDGNPINGTTLPFNGGTPRHWNCRSVLTAITYTYKELGIDIPEAPPGTRASDIGQIPADTSFESFLGRHDSAYVDNLLGHGRAQLWRDGKITLQQLVGGDGRELTLKQLKAL